MSKQHVLVVGASSSIGREVIRRIAHQDMVVLAQFHTNAEALADLARAVPATVVPIRADLRLEADLEAMLRTIETHCPFPEKVVFLAAPRVALIRFKDMAWSDVHARLDVELRTAVTVCARFLPRMAAAKLGKLVFVLSSYTLGVPPAAMAHYVTSKYALLGLMKALASEYAAKGVCVNAISPSMVETGFLADIPDMLVELAADQHPLKRNASPGDVAPMVEFLLSPAADYMTGVNVPITGGAA